MERKKFHEFYFKLSFPFTIFNGAFFGLLLFHSPVESHKKVVTVEAMKKKALDIK